MASKNRNHKKAVKKPSSTTLAHIIDPVDNKNFFVRNIWLILSFFIPFALMFVCFAIVKVSPFGDQQILVTDLWHQYYPFLVDFQDKLKEGGSLFWTWKSGGGTNYLAMMSYYLASPLNFLSVFVPAKYLREFLAFIVCIKIGFAGFSFSQFLRITFKKSDASVTVFSVMFALCSFIMGYYWNIIWLDTIAILPLVVAGAVALLKDGKFKLYVLSLGIAILANYYIGLFVCIFVVLVSIVYCIVEYTNVKDLFKKFFAMLLYSVVGVGLSAILTLPAAFALQTTHSSNNTFPVDYAINIGETADFKGTMQAISEVISNSVAFIEPTTKEGLPNIYCGIAALVLGLLFFTCSKIKIRERIAGGALLVFFILSFVIRQLDFIWHGFHFPNMLPYRFSFLFSFVLITMAYRVFMNIEHTKLVHVLISAGLFAIILAIAHEYQDTKAIVASAFIAFLIIAWLMLYSLKVVPKEALCLALVIICLAEASCTAFIGVKAVGTTGTANYPLGGTNTENMVDKIEKLESDDIDLERTEVTKYYTLNDNALSGFDGISMFNSMTNSDVTAYMEKFGICGWVASNRYTYQESSPVTNMFLNIKYLLSPYGIYLDKEHMQVIDQSGSVKLLQNKYYIPQGFMVNKDMLEFDVNMATSNPFVNQNELFRLATGLDGDVYQPLEVVSQGHTDFEQFPVTKSSYGSYSFELKDSSVSPHLKYNYEAPYDGTAYAYFQCGEGENVNLMLNDNTLLTNYVKRPYIMQVGSVEKGDKISVYSDLKDVTVGSCHVYCVMLNEELFEQGYEKLAESALNATKVTDTAIEGTIDAKEDGLFYTSISYDKGWSAYVDDKEVEITPVGNALVAFELDAGHHEIKLKYCPPGFVLGLSVTLVCLLAFVALVLVRRKRDLSTAVVESKTDKTK